MKEGQRNGSVDSGSIELKDVPHEPAPVTTHMGCGFGRCRPHFLQIFANPIVFMITLNIYCLVEGAIVSGKPSVFSFNILSGVHIHHIQNS